jgi:hypothetical protein
MDLTAADFTGADLSAATLAGADLRQAKLARTVLLGADLSGAQLTGAVISHWNTDKKTLFTGVGCDYVFLDEARQKRQPESGKDFRPGEFAKLYQEIAHTVDFLIENTAQMEAMLRSLAKIREEFGGKDAARVQKVERKDGGFKVSVEVPPEWEAELRRELRHEFEGQLKALEAEQRYLSLGHQKDVEHLQRERDHLAAMLALALSRPNQTDIHIKAEAMNDYSRKIEHSTITDAAVNLGDHASAHNESHIGVPPAQIAPLLQQLREAIQAEAALPAPLKDSALQQVEALRAAAAKPPAEAKAAALGPLEALKMLSSLAVGLGSLLSAIEKLF